MFINALPYSLLHLFTKQRQFTNRNSLTAFQFFVILLCYIFSATRYQNHHHQQKIVSQYFFYGISKISHSDNKKQQQTNKKIDYNNQKKKTISLFQKNTNDFIQTKQFVFHFKHLFKSIVIEDLIKIQQFNINRLSPNHSSQIVLVTINWTIYIFSSILYLHFALIYFAHFQIKTSKKKTKHTYNFLCSNQLHMYLCSKVVKYLPNVIHTHTIL